MNTELKEKIYEQLFDYFDDNTDELFDAARELYFDWAMTYEGAEEVYDNYFCQDIVDTINAFVDARLNADNYTEYCFDGLGSLYEVDDFDVDEHLDEVVERLIAKCENGIPTSLSYVLSSEVCEILEQKAVSFEDLFDSCHRHFTGVCVRSNVASETVSDFLQKCRRVTATESVLQYLCKTNFCGVPEEACEKIMEDYEQPNNECSVASVISAEWLEEYGCDSNVTVRKYADMFMEKYKEV